MPEKKPIKSKTGKKKVAVLMGGPSHEHDVSVKSGRRVVNKLHPEKYDVEPVFISREGVWDLSLIHI